jgi:PAS domain S-box-containing protein
VLEALPELAGTPIVDTLQQVYQTGEMYVTSEMPVHLVRREGGPLEESFWTFVYQARRNEQEQIDGIIVFAHEVTNQVQARRAIERNAQQLRLLTDALPVLIGYLDRERRYRFANEAYRAWFHQAPAALVGQHVRDVVGEKAYAVVCGYMDRALAGERLDFEAKMPYREDFTKYIRTSYVPDVRGGEVVGFYTLINDITEQVLAHQQVHKLNEELQVANQDLRHSNSKLQRTNTDLDTFVYAASHDLRSPIVNIVGLLDLLRHQLLSETQDVMLLRLVDMMEESITRFRQTVDHLGNIARLQDEPEQAREKIELARFIDDIRLDLLPLLESTHATLKVDVTACPTLRFSPKDLRSILFNLLSNAVKYHAPDRVPLVQVRAQCHANQLVLEVEDNGVGLDEKQQSKLFAMFRRLHTHVEGSGVGLYLIKRLIENADGTIRVWSQVGVGSTFTVTLPI